MKSTMKRGRRRTFNLRQILGIGVVLVIILFGMKVVLSFHMSSNQAIDPPLSVEEQYHVTDPPKYLMYIPAFGPNNQYRGLKEMMVAAHVLNRIFVTPAFVAHHVKGPSGFRPFNETFQEEPMQKFVKTINLDEFKKVCDGKIDKLIWVRKIEGWWNTELDNYLSITGIRIGESIPADDADLKNQNTKQMAISDKKQLVEWLTRKGAIDARCLGIAFPFRTFDGELGSNDKFLGKAAVAVERAQKIKDMAKQAIEEIGSSKDELLTMHWRWGEQTCMAENKLLHQGYDFCWGTSVYFWAKSGDLITSVKKFMESKKLIKIYLATDSKDRDVMAKFSKELPIKRASEVPTLKNITDNYILSLVEQEICTQSKMFVASWGSTWSEYIDNYWQVTGRSVRDSFFSMDRLLTENGFKYISHDFWGYVQKVPPLPPKAGTFRWVSPTLGEYVGCFDDNFPRMFFSDLSTADMTHQKCAESCGAQMFAYSATQYAKECYCGMDIIESRKVPDSECNMPCTGDKSSMCGASWRNTIHKIKERDPMAPGVNGNAQPSGEPGPVTAPAPLQPVSTPKSDEKRSASESNSGPIRTLEPLPSSEINVPKPDSENLPKHKNSASPPSQPHPPPEKESAL